MKFVKKPLKIGTGVRFDEAQKIYELYINKLSKREQRYTHIKPLFIHIGKTRVLGLHETVSQVSVVVPNDRYLSKQKWCDSIKLKEVD